MSKWLLERLLETKPQPEPRFAFQGTVNWIRALSLIIEKSDLEKNSFLKDFYSTIKPREIMDRNSDTLTFEALLMAFHNLSSLNKMKSSQDSSYDLCRSAIVSWYYCTYFSASAMIAATSGASPDNHTKTATVWQDNIIRKKLIPYPFDLSISDLSKSSIVEAIKTFVKDQEYNLSDTYAVNLNEAHGVIVSYLKGTANYLKDKTEDNIKQDKNFKKLGVSDFRTKKTREFRDSRLEKKHVNFLNQAFRFRGKANYRDSLFLSYGDDNTTKLITFIEDLFTISKSFLKVSAYYSSRKVEKGSWKLFIDDLEENSKLSASIDIFKF
ncbi:hypothetical protein [Francisella sp. 19X1-34]|uniref:hypothetical protein n=1 Tax=Francisella sp. 19X1-34 TaxID=3087177 RepID=UPI002E336C26|nr:hypothetical protein [Francisella sp. 19X1-34]MED7788126.1 hypothetical protein [Francisella sp. 19X1-34]